MSESLVKRIYSTPLFRHSFWSILGNGLGNMLLLLAGIFIARMLGKDVYGEYGLVKTTMFHVASFATFGLVYTSTKFVAQFIEVDKSKVVNIVKACLSITLFSSSLMCLVLFLFSKELALFVNEPKLANAFKYLGIIIVFRALSTTLAGILGGFKEYKAIGINNIFSGLLLLLCSIPLTYYGGVHGSLVALLMSQLLNTLLHVTSLLKVIKPYYSIMSNDVFYRKIMTFSIPVAMQELSWTISNWGYSLLLAKYASLGELGIYTAAAQWYAISIYLPSLLSNVILSYLSGVSEKDAHNVLVKRMLWVNAVSAMIPIVLVASFSSLIVSFYGQSFNGLRPVIIILLFSSLFNCLSQVFQSDLISRAKNWHLFFVRLFRDVSCLLALAIVLLNTGGINAAYNFAIISVCSSLLYFIIIALVTISINERDYRVVQYESR